MMTYEYECPACRIVTMARRSVQDRHRAPACLQCGGPTLKRYSRATLITDRVHERDHWREPLSRTDLLAEQKRCERLADAQFDRVPDWDWLQPAEASA